MMLRRLSVAVAIILSTLLQPFAASPADGGIQRLPAVEKQDIRFEALSIGGKPLQKRVFAVAQDNYGFLWLGTDDGLYRYDGYSLRHYSHEPGNPRSLTDNMVMLIYKDRAGILWIGTASGGLDRFDPAGDTFTHYRHDPNDPHSLRDDYIAALYQDRTGSMWVDTVKGFSRLDVASGRFFHYADPVEEIARRHVVREFFEDSQGNLLVGYAQGLYKLDRTSGRLSRIWNSPRSEFTGPSNPGVQWLPGSVGKAWFTSLSENMIGSLDTGSGGCRCFALPWDGAHNPPTMEFHRVLEDRSGVLWIGSRRGMFRVDNDRKNFVRYTDQPDRGMGGLIWALLEDSEGNLWVGSEAGLSRFQTTSAAFVNYRHDPRNPNSLRSNKVLSALADKRGLLWIGTNAGLHRLDRKTGQMVVYQNDPRDTHSLSHNTVTAIKEDGAGNLWIGTQGGGLNRFDPDSERFVVYRSKRADSQGLSSDDIRGLAVEPGGVVWIATVGGGVSRFDPETGHFRTYRNDPQISGALSHDVVFSVFVDRKGTLWAGTIWGLNRLDSGAERFKVYQQKEQKRAGLSNSGIASIYEDRQGTLWIGTRAGLNRFDRNRDSFEPVTTQNGLENDYIQDIREDSRGNLWLATHEGLSEFDPRTGKVRNYSEGDGLPGNFANPTITERSTVTPEGELIFGSGHGLTVVNPARISANAFRPPVVLTDFLLFNQPVVPSRDSPLRQPIWATKAIALQHWQSNITIGFASLSYVTPERNRYRYRLEGYEQNWNEVGADRRTATYTNLAPDRYVFRVQGSNNDLLWNEAGASLEITVFPPLWGTWWFRSFALLATAGLAVTAYRLRIRSLRLAAQRLEAEVDKRTRELKIARDAADAASRAKSSFLANMSHELRTPLNAILGFSNILRERRVSEEEQGRNLDIINRSGHHLLQLIEDVLDMAKIEAGGLVLEKTRFDLPVLVQDVADMMSERARAKNLQLLVDVSHAVPRFVRSDASRLRQVLVNLIGNAVKFTDQGGVVVKLEVNPGDNGKDLVLIFVVEDTGIGIAPEDKERIFDPFVQASKARTTKGTGLGLSISRRIVQLLGGSLNVESTPGRGSRFHLEVPAERAEASDAKGESIDNDVVVGLEPGQPDYRMLIVEDQRENWLLLEGLLSGTGFQVRTAEDGVQAIETFGGWRPHFIWMDLGLPGISGLEASRRIREMEGGREVKIVAVTASAFASQREEVLAAGLDDFLRKPYWPREIFDCIARHLGVRYVYGAAPMPVAAGEPFATLRPEDLGTIPEEVRQALENAVIALDVKRIAGVISQVSEQNAALGSALTRLANAYAYSPILKALRSFKTNCTESRL